MKIEGAGGFVEAAFCVFCNRRGLRGVKLAGGGWSGRRRRLRKKTPGRFFFEKEDLFSGGGFLFFFNRTGVLFLQ